MNRKDFENFLGIPENFSFSGIPKLLEIFRDKLIKHKFSQHFFVLCLVCANLVMEFATTRNRSFALASLSPILYRCVILECFYAPSGGNSVWCNGRKKIRKPDKLTRVECSIKFEKEKARNSEVIFDIYFQVWNQISASPLWKWFNFRNAIAKLFYLSIRTSLFTKLPWPEENKVNFRLRVKLSSAQLSTTHGIGVARIFDWVGQTMQWRHQKFSKEELWMGAKM